MRCYRQRELRSSVSRDRCGTDPVATRTVAVLHGQPEIDVGASSTAYRAAAPRHEADGVYRHRKSNHREEPEPRRLQSSPDNRRPRALNRITRQQHVIDPPDIRNKRRRRLTPRAAVLVY